MVGDVRRLEKQVSSTERTKLGHHLEAIEDMQRQGKAIANMSDAIRRGAPKISENFTAALPSQRLDAHFDIAAGALIAGLSKVVTIRPDGLATGYTGLGIEGVNVHGIGHGKAPEGFATPDAARDAIRQCHVANIAKLARKLQAVPEGDGTMLDNTTIIYFSDVGDKHHATNRQWPFIVVGNMGGRLSGAGRYLQYPGKERDGHHTIANWWMTLLHAAGAPRDVFGMTDPKIAAAAQRGPLAELLV
jgi:hypothetical protein